MSHNLERPTSTRDDNRNSLSNTLNNERAGSDQNEKLPSYIESYPSQLSFISPSRISPSSHQPMQLVMKGESRSSDFQVFAQPPPYHQYTPQSEMQTNQQPLFTISTSSTQINHESYIKDYRPGGTSWFLPRHKTPLTRDQDEMWTYTIKAMGSDGAKLLEIQTTQSTFSASESSSQSSKTAPRLVFRSSLDNELDALYIARPSRSSITSSSTSTDRSDGGRLFEIHYQKQRVGTIKRLASDRCPDYLIDVEVPGIDAILFVVLAIVFDDRNMTDRRRYKSAATRGLAQGSWNGAVRSLPVLALGL